MWFFWIVDLIIPVTMLFISFHYKKKGKSEISRISGFRTSESMESKESWKYAHDVASVCLKRVGILLILYLVIIKSIKPLSAEYLSLINNFIYIVSFNGISIYTSKKLKKHFHH